MLQTTNAKLTVAVLLALSSTVSNAEMFELGSGNNNLTVLSPSGAAIGGMNDFVVMWDGTFNTDVATAITNMTLSSSTPFFGQQFFIHDVQVYGPGTYVFEACLPDGSQIGSTVCDGSQSALQTMVVGEGQAGVHLLFDWNSSVNVDVVNVWNVDAVWGFGPNDGSNTNFLEGRDIDCFPRGRFGDPLSSECVALYATEWMFTATDPDGDGVAGMPMIDGPFISTSASFNFRAAVLPPVPVPAAVWLMGSGLFGLIGVARRKKR